MGTEMGEGGNTRVELSVCRDEVASRAELKRKVKAVLLLIAAHDRKERRRRLAVGTALSTQHNKTAVADI
jgi:hypothetical protein